MGAPWFEIRHLAESEGLLALSANFALFGDLSDRMMSLAAGLGPRQEIYSIDESFIDLTGVRGDLVERSHKIRARRSMSYVRQRLPTLSRDTRRQANAHLG